MAKLKKYHETTSNLVDTIGFVATGWNSTEHGHLARNVNKFYWTAVKDFPKADFYFVDIKPKSTRAKKGKHWPI